MPDTINSKDKTNTGTLSEKKSEFIKDLRDRVAEDKDSRAIWLNKMVIATNQRLGVRRQTNFPYTGAPNIPLPETDKLVKKSIPNLVLSTAAPKKRAVVRLADGVKENKVLKEKIRKSEAALNMVLRSKKMDLFRKLLLSADFAKHHGHMLTRVVEKFETRIVHEEIDKADIPQDMLDQLKAASKPELQQFVSQRYNLDLEDDDEKEVVNDIIKQFKSGADIIEFDIERVSSMPDIEIPLPTKMIVPSYTTGIEDANRITYEFFMTRRQLEMKMDDGSFRKHDIDDLNFTRTGKSGANTTGDDSDVVEHQKRINEGITNAEADRDLFKIHETLCWYKPKKNKPMQRWVFTTFAEVHDPDHALLQDMEFPYDFTDDTWNYDKYDNEVKDPRYYNSRGVPEQIRALQEIQERAINNMLIRDEMNNTPMWEVLSSSEIMDGHIQFGPGQKLPVDAIGQEIKRLGEPNNVDISSDRIMQIVKATAEEYLGNVDQLFRNATNTGGGKTLGEIQEGVRQSTGPISVEVINWNETWSRTFQKVFDIMRDRVGESIFIDGEEITNEDFNFPAEVRSNGNLEVSDQQLAVQKAITRLQVIIGLEERGVVDKEDIFRATQDWLEKDGIKDPDMFSTDPKIILQSQLAQLQQAVQQLQSQAQQLDEVAQDSRKEVSKVRKQGKNAVSKIEGEMEAVSSEKTEGT